MQEIRMTPRQGEFNDFPRFEAIASKSPVTQEAGLEMARTQHFQSEAQGLIHSKRQVVSILSTEHRKKTMNSSEIWAGVSVLWPCPKRL